MTILVTADGCFTGADLEVGSHYRVELDSGSATNAQNNAFHALVQAYWTSGCHSAYNAKNLDQFRSFIKRDLGAGFEAYYYADDDLSIKRVESESQIPAHIRADVRRIRGKLKSWADYTKKERRRTIDNLIAEMEQAGVNSPYYREILAGMNKEMWK